MPSFFNLLENANDDLYPKRLPPKKNQGSVFPEP